VSSPGRPFRVLYVCTGNICRSAVAERLLRRDLAARLGARADLVQVESAGVRGLVGEPIDRDSAAALTALGGDPDGFAARLLDAGLVQDADLVITANRRHRATVVRLEPSAAGRTFTMRELAQLADLVELDALPGADPRARLEAAVREVAAARGSVRPDDRHDLDVEDPYGSPPAVHRRTTDVIAQATGAAARLLAAAAEPELAGSLAQERARNGRPDAPPARPAPRARDGRRRTWRIALLVVAALLFLLLAAAAWLGWTGLRAKHELDDAQPLVGQVRTAVLQGDTARTKSLVAELQQHTSAARARTGGPVWSLGAHVPAYGDDLSAVRQVTVSVDDVAQQVLPPLVGVAATLRPEELRTGGDRIALQPLRDAEPALAAALARSLAVQRDVAAIETAGLVPQVRSAVSDLRGDVGQLVSTTRAGQQAARLIPPMLGADGPRRYLLAFQTNAEVRGTGGLLGAYGVLEADDGVVRLRALGSNNDLENPPRLPVDLGPDFAQLYGRAPRLWVNANASAHFPYAARLWLASWERQHGQRLDGVVATDPVAIGDLLEATGPVRLPGGDEVTAENAARLMLSDVYARYPSFDDSDARDRYLQSVASAVFDGILGGQGNPQRLADELADAARDRRLLVYSDRPGEQATLGRTALSGVVPDTAAPLLGVVVNSGVASKLDYYLRRKVSWTSAGCGPAGQASKVVVTLTNTAPRSGLPEYVAPKPGTQGGPAVLARLPRGTDYLLVNVLTTRGTQLRSASVDGQAGTASVGAERGHPVFGLDVAIRPGQTRTLTLDLVTPGRLRGRPVIVNQPLATSAPPAQVALAPCERAAR
jgi:protein-tyrosine-phosphatase